MGYNKPVGGRGNKQERKGVVIVIVARQRGYRSKPGPWFQIERKEPESAVKSKTNSNRRMAAVWWEAATSPTATRGHTIPPILPTALANPVPLAGTDIGYSYR